MIWQAKKGDTSQVTTDLEEEEEEEIKKIPEGGLNDVDPKGQ